MIYLIWSPTHSRYRVSKLHVLNLDTVYTVFAGHHLLRVMKNFKILTFKHELIWGLLTGSSSLGWPLEIAGHSLGNWSFPQKFVDIFDWKFNSQKFSRSRTSKESRSPPNKNGPKNSRALFGAFCVNFGGIAGAIISQRLLLRHHLELWQHWRRRRFGQGFLEDKLNCRDRYLRSSSGKHYSGLRLTSPPQNWPTISGIQYPLLRDGVWKQTYLRTVYRILPEQWSSA